jgi:hypothetical protein
LPCTPKKWKETLKRMLAIVPSQFGKSAITIRGALAKNISMP